MDNLIMWELLIIRLLKVILFQIITFKGLNYQVNMDFIRNISFKKMSKYIFCPWKMPKKESKMNQKRKPGRALRSANRHLTSYI